MRALILASVACLLLVGCSNPAPTRTPSPGYVIESDRPLPSGRVRLGFEFDYDGGGLHKGATGRLSIDGEIVGEGRIERTMGAIYSLAGETADVGVDAFSPVTDDYDAWDNAFTGTIHKIDVELTDEAHAGPERPAFRN